MVAPTDDAVCPYGAAVSGEVGDAVGRPRPVLAAAAVVAAVVPLAPVAPMAEALPGAPALADGAAPSEAEIGARGASADNVSVGDIALDCGEPDAPALPEPEAVLVGGALYPCAGALLPGVA